MAYTFFNMAASGGSNANSGSSSSVIYTSSSAVWDGTSTLTVTGAGAVQVNDWINVNSAYIAQVTSASPTSIVLSTANKYGTAPTAGTYTINDGGYFASLAIFTNIFNIAPPPISTCVQIPLITITLSGSQNINVLGTTLAPFWLRGYSVTPGDLDSGSTTLSYPTIAVGTQALGISSEYGSITGFNFTSATRVGSVVSFGGNIPMYVRHCRFINTENNSSAAAISNTGADIDFTYCYFQATGALSGQIVTNTGGGCSFNGCWIAGNGAGTSQVGVVGSSTIMLNNCVIYNPGLHGMSMTTINMTAYLKNVTFYLCGGDSIHLAAIPTQTFGTTIENCLFLSSAAYDINTASGHTPPH